MFQIQISPIKIHVHQRKKCKIAHPCNVCRCRIGVDACDHIQVATEGREPFLLDFTGLIPTGARTEDTASWLMPVSD